MEDIILQKVETIQFFGDYGGFVEARAPMIPLNLSITFSDSSYEKATCSVDNMGTSVSNSEIYTISNDVTISLNCD